MRTPSIPMVGKGLNSSLWVVEACLTLPPHMENLFSCVEALDKELHV